MDLGRWEIPSQQFLSRGSMCARGAGHGTGHAQHRDSFLNRLRVSGSMLRKSYHSPCSKTAPTTSWGRLCEQIVDRNGVVVSKWTVCAPVLGHQCLVGLILKYKVLLFDPTNNCRFAGDILRCTELSGRKKKDKGRDSDMTGHCRLSHY